MDGKKRILSKEEKDLWKNVISDVEPLTIPESRIEAALNRVERNKQNKQAPPIKEVFLKPVDTKFSHGSAPSLDRATQQKLRRGKIKIEASIDLHGLTQDEAYQVLSNFLYNSRTEGLRSVLVITGKGVGGRGVLRASVPKWLNEGNNQQMIRAFSYAAPKDGGEGALYVLLKRIK